MLCPCLFFSGPLIDGDIQTESFYPITPTAVQEMIVFWQAQEGTIIHFINNMVSLSSIHALGKLRSRSVRGVAKILDTEINTVTCLYNSILSRSVLTSCKRCHDSSVTMFTHFIWLYTHCLGTLKNWKFFI